MLQSVLRPLASRASFVARGAAIQKRTILTLKDHKYTGHATASGSGRSGHVVCEGNGAAPLELNLSGPKSMGGTGTGQNPEQLFAAAHAACFLGAVQLAARQSGKKELAANAKIHTSVHIGEPIDKPGLAIAVDIEVEGVPDEQIIQAAHDMCPYSRALSLGAEVTVKKK